MSGLTKKPMLEFEWDEDFEAKLAALLLDYRLSEKSTGNPYSRGIFERALSAATMQKLRTLIESRRPMLDADTDIALLVDGLRRRP